MGHVVFPDGKISKDMRYNGKKILRAKVDGKNVDFVELNSYTGTFTDHFKKDAFMDDSLFQVADNAFQGETPLATIKMPYVINVGDNSFRGCNHLTNIKLPKVVGVGTAAFRDTAITGVSLPECLAIDNEGFMGCPITNINLPKVQTIGSNGFNTARIAEIHLPECTSIGQSAFWTADIKKVDIPKVKILENHVFEHSYITEMNAPAMTTIHGDPVPQRRFAKLFIDSYPDYNDLLTGRDWTRIKELAVSNTTIDPNTFTGVPQLTYLRAIHATAIGSRAVEDSVGLRALVLPKVQRIEHSVAWRSTAMTEADYPECTFIGHDAFYSAPLTRINVPKADTLEDNCFRKVVNASTTTVTMKSKFNNSSDKNRIFDSNWNNITFTWV